MGAARRRAAGAGNAQAHLVETRLRAEIEGLAVLVAPRHVVRMLRTGDRAEVPAFGRQDPETAGAGNVEVALLIHLDAVDGVLPRGRGHVEEELAPADRAV